MDCVSPILDIVTRLWNCTANRAVYIRDLQDSLNSLRELKLELENISKDVEGRTDFAEQQQYSARTNQVKGWLQSVQLKLKVVDDILQKGDEEIQQKCLGSCCPRHCRTSYKLGKQVIKEINVVQELIRKGHFDVVADKVPRPMIDEMPMEKTVGMDYMFDDVWKCVQDHEARIIGLYELECLEKITQVGLSFSSVSFVLKFMSSPKLQSCITRLSISECEELRSLDISCSSMRRMEHLEILNIIDCHNLREVKICLENGERMQRSEPNCFCNLQILSISYCAMENLTWLIYTPRLQFLDVMECESLEEIIAWDFAGSSEIEEAAEIFSNLVKVSLRRLPKLKSICRRAMSFPSLRDVRVFRCKSLRKLPFNAQSAKSLKAIRGQRDWSLVGQVGVGR
ncbi:hypothetical protein Dsin_013532 [Dipteronia sinensis]|uniref:Disease resistance protein At4g27190-like leucine-rich repeats domain-containing protein n=1 Tax=Dipteronia sinensis TaxID=43782 RepID=A0AAE0E9I7_9ROSI|nr:hypothetical protein Dsin_013532 [Dipteronia sinensis]